jgi:DNA (cytosine-5)-methyltransferase 1
MKARLLDLFCRAGGASVGYSRAGFEVEGVDIEPQPNYPFKFYQADVLTFPLDGYDAYHASPPCQRYSRTKSLHPGWEYPDLLGRTRDLLIATGKPWIIENVVGAPFQHWIMLCGMMFGLRTYRHRRFETSFLMMQPEHPRHIERVLNRGYDPDWTGFYCVTGGCNAPVAVMREVMGIDWMTRADLTQAIPPAYSEYIGRYLMQCLMQ